MVSLKFIERDVLSEQRNDPLSYLSVPLRGSFSGIEVPVYRFGSPSTRGSECFSGIPFSSDVGQTLLDSLFLAKWEDLAWRNILQYDVTACPTRVVNGGKGFFVQLNENLKINSILTGSNQLSSPFELNVMNVLKEDILLCLERGEKNRPVLVPSAAVPKDYILIVVNATPIEYGHVLLVPYHFHGPADYLDSLEAMVQVASEISNCSFRICYDQHAISNPGHAYFQACYFANQLAVERMPTSSLLDAHGEGIAICEIIGYPIRTLMFSSNKNLKLLATIVSETCSFLNEQFTPFNLLISDCGRKIFLFLQTDAARNHLSAWECGGHFVLNTLQEFDQTNEDDILQQMAAASLDDDSFQVVKRISCDIANMLAPTGQCS